MTFFHSQNKEENEMSKVNVFMANGMEEVECLAVVDMLRRAGVKVETVSVMERRMVESSHGVTILADKVFDETDFSDSDALFLPGGLGGTKNLAGHQGLCELLKNFHARGGRIAAICAAPSILGDLGLLQGKTATCYPGFEEHLAGAVYTRQGVVTDGNITTGRGVGFAVDMGLELVRLLVGEAAASELKAGIQHPDC